MLCTAKKRCYQIALLLNVTVGTQSPTTGGVGNLGGCKTIGAVPAEKADGPSEELPNTPTLMTNKWQFNLLSKPSLECNYLQVHSRGKEEQHTHTHTHTHTRVYKGTVGEIGIHFTNEFGC